VLLMLSGWISQSSLQSDVLHLIGRQDRQSPGAGAVAMQWSPGRNPHLSPGLPEPDRLPGIPPAIRTVDSERYSERIHGWKECMCKNGWYHFQVAFCSVLG